MAKLLAFALRSFPVLLLAFTLLLALPQTGLAGTVTVKDNAGVLSRDQVQTLTANARNLQPNFVILIENRRTNNAASSGDFANFVRSNLPGEDGVALGLNTDLRYTFLEAGKNSGISPAQTGTLAAAGDSFFKNQDWAGGLNAIVNGIRSAAPVRQGAAPTPTTQPTQRAAATPAGAAPTPFPVLTATPVPAAAPVVEKKEGPNFGLIFGAVLVIGGILALGFAFLRLRGKKGPKAAPAGGINPLDQFTGGVDPGFGNNQSGSFQQDVPGGKTGKANSAGPLPPINTGSVPPVAAKPSGPAPKTSPAQKPELDWLSSEFQTDDTYLSKEGTVQSDPKDRKPPAL